MATKKPQQAAGPNFRIKHETYVALGHNYMGTELGFVTAVIGQQSVMVPANRLDGCLTVAGFVVRREGDRPRAAYVEVRGGLAIRIINEEGRDEYVREGYSFEPMMFDVLSKSGTWVIR